VNRWLQKRINPDVVVRMIADAIMVCAGLFMALVARYWWSGFVTNNGALSGSRFMSWMDCYIQTYWMLLLISLTVFYASNFYDSGRRYRGRYKALMVIQAVSLSYLIFAMVVLMLRNLILWPRSVLVLGWGLTLVLVLGARFWMIIWRALTGVEHEPYSTMPPEHERGRVLVIGGAGYIGSALVGRLLDSGYNVRVLDLLIYGDDSILKYRRNPNFHLIKGDFRHIEDVVRAIKGINSIVHLGAIVGDPACSLSEDLTINTNLRATATIAQVGKGFGATRFVFASTCAVYGASDEILDEKSSLNPVSLYARTKAGSEKLLLNLHDSNFAPIILRFGTIYGLSERLRFDLVVNLLAAKAVQDGEVGIFGGSQWRPLVHVQDVAEAILLSLQAPLDSVGGQIFNVGSNEQNYRLDDLGSIIKKMVPTARVVTQPQEDNRNYRVKFDKVHKLLNFQPKYTVQDGVREVISAITTGQVGDYRDPRYNNCAFLGEQTGLIDILLDDDYYPDWNTLLSCEETTYIRHTDNPSLQRGVA